MKKFLFYVEFQDLPPTIDEKNVADEVFLSLEEKGFDVEKVELINSVQMERQLALFWKRMEDAKKAKGITV